MTRSSQRHRQRGFALLIVLWTLVLITLLVTQLTSAGRSEAQLAANLREAGQLEAVADGAVHTAIFHLMDRTQAAWRADGTSRTLRFGADTAEIRITDEAGKVNPSNATPELLQALMRARGVDATTASQLAAAIVVWRTPSGTQATSGPRFDAYRAAARAYGPSGAPFLSMDELGAVIGMTPPLLTQLAPHLTLYTADDPDPALADPVVRQALAAANGGRLPVAGGEAGQIQVIVVTATATDANGGRFTRRAIVRLDRAGVRPDYRILTWDAPADA